MGEPFDSPVAECRGRHSMKALEDSRGAPWQPVGDKVTNQGSWDSEPYQTRARATPCLSRGPQLGLRTPGAVGQ